MNLTLVKLKGRIPDIIAAAARETLPIAEVFHCAVSGPFAAGAMAAPPPPDDPAWALLRQDQRWGLAPGADPAIPPRKLNWGIPADGGSNHWLRATLRLPQAWQGQQVRLALAWEGRGQSSIEAIVYLDGAALVGLDEFHRNVALPATAHSGDHELLIRCFVPFPNPFGGLRLVRCDETIFQLGQTMHTLLAAVETYAPTDPLRHNLLDRLNAAYNMLDLREGWQGETFAATAHSALAMLKVDDRQQTIDDGPGSASSIAFVPTQAGVHRPSAAVPTIVATGHAHLDIAWLWPLWRTRQKVAHTVATALHLMERFPDYYFSLSQPQVYAYLKHDDPALYARLKQRVAEGRFEPVGMMWLEADCNLPSGESLVRQLLHGARFWQEEFGRVSRLVWLPDVFGYSAALPQLMRSCGIDCFVTTKISWNQFNRMPYDTFRWRGIDGSEVLTHFVTASERPASHPADAHSYTYNGLMSAGEVAGTWRHYRQQRLNNELLYIYGHGDGGGGPTEEMLAAARLMRDLPGFPQVQLGRVEQFFERLYRRVWADPRLPTWVGELYLEYHRGTYTSQAHTKQANRAAELLYREAEWLNAWAVTLGAASRQDELNTGWKLILLNQFHDILPGSGIAQVYVDSQTDYAEIQRIGREVCEWAAGFILQTMNGEGRTPASDEFACIVWNTLPWDRTDYALLESPAGIEPGNPDVQQVTDFDGQQALLVETHVPAYGYVWLTNNQQLQTDDQHPPREKHHSSFSAHRSALANSELRLELDEHGEISSLYDLRHGREVIAPGMAANQLILYEDRPLAWDAWDIDLFYEEKPYPVREIVDWRLVETGPLRAAIEIVRRAGRSTICQRICLWRNSRRVDFVTEVDWHERQMLLRTLFPLNVNADKATCEIQFGAVERPTHRNTSWDLARFEVCAHRWVDLSEGNYGVALLNDGKYGHSLRHNTLGLSLLKAGVHPDPAADQGLHRFTYSLLPHPGDWRAAQVVRRAYELNAPMRGTKNAERGMLQSETNDSSLITHRSSFVSCDAAHVVVETIKMAEDGNGLIVRLYETHNQRGLVSLTFAYPVAGAVEVNLLEEETGPAEVTGNTVRFDVRPFEVKTLRVKWAAIPL